MPEINPRYCVAIRGAISPSGDVALEFVPEHGEHIQVSFPISAIPSLRAILDEMEQAMKKKAN